MATRQRQPTEQRRIQIAQAALEIIAEEGVQRLTAMAIARRVGIADGTIFRHFKNKDEIVRAAIDHVAAVLSQGFPFDDEDPLDRLGHFFKSRLALARKHPLILRVAMGDRLTGLGGTEGAERMAAMREGASAFVRACLVEAQQRGRVAKDLSPDVLAAVVIGTLRTSALGELAPNKPPTPARLWKDLESLLSRS